MAPARLNPAPAIAKRTTSEMRTVVGIASATVADDMSHIAAAKIAAAMGGGTLAASVDMLSCVMRPNGRKLSDGGGWRDGCMAVERRRPEAGAVTRRRVRCSA